MAEVKTDFASGEELEASALNSINAEINKNGGLKDDIDGGETISGATTPQASFIKEADGELYACDANDTARLRFDGFVISDTTDGNPADFRGSGIVAGFSGLTPGAKYYVQDDKSIGTSVGTYNVPVGIAISATEIMITKDKTLHYISLSASAYQTATNSWTDWDLSGSLPAGAVAAEFVVETRAGDVGNVPGLRNNGSALTRYLPPPASATAIHYTASCDIGSDRTVEIYTSNTGSSKFSLIGYWI